MNNLKRTLILNHKIEQCQRVILKIQNRFRKTMMQINDYKCGTIYLIFYFTYFFIEFKVDIMMEKLFSKTIINLIKTTKIVTANIVNV